MTHSVRKSICDSPLTSVLYITYKSLKPVHHKFNFAVEFKKYFEVLCRSMVLSPIISHQFFVRICIISSCFKDSLTYSYFCKVKFQFFLKVFRKLRDVSDFILPEKTRFSSVVRGIGTLVRNGFMQ